MLQEETQYFVIGHILRAPHGRRIGELQANDKCVLEAVFNAESNRSILGQRSAKYEFCVRLKPAGDVRHCRIAFESDTGIGDRKLHSTRDSATSKPTESAAPR